MTALAYLPLALLLTAFFWLLGDLIRSRRQVSMSPYAEALRILGEEQQQ